MCDGRKTLSKHAAKRFHDRIGSRYDWFELYEGRAKECVFAALQLAPGQKLLSVGIGTGKELIPMIKVLRPDVITFGLDISTLMLNFVKSAGSSIVKREVIVQLGVSSELILATK